MKDTPFFVYNRDFTLLGLQHLTVLVLTVLLGIVLPLFSKRYLKVGQQLRLSRAMALLVACWAWIYIPILLWLGDFDGRTDLPLDICNLMAATLPVLMWKPSYRVHEVLYFWVLAGTLQAILTPHLYNGFPNFIFIRYWVVHSGLVVYIIYVTIVFDFKPTLKSLWKSFAILQGYVLLILVINLLLDANYVYVLRKPPTASVLDYFGPWPWYLLVCELVALFLFHIALAPFRQVAGNRVKISSSWISRD